MKKYTIVALALLLTASVAAAAPTKAPAVALKTHVVATEVVKADVAAKTLTLKGENNTEMTMPCQGKAVAELKTVTPGEKVNVICQDNAKGEHLAIIGITAASHVHPAKSGK